jgi:hypothetical protein
VLDEFDQPSVIDGVEEITEIGIEHPIHLRSQNPDGKRIERIVLAAPRAEPIREAEDVHLVDGVQHLDHGSLDKLVFQRGDAERPLPPVDLRDVHPPRRSRPVRPLMEPCVKVEEVGLQVLPVLLPRHPVDSWRGPLLKREVRVAKPIDGEVVEERRELCFPVLSCSLAYTVERTGRTFDPALRPGCVLLVRVPLGQAPSLHPLRSGRLRFVRGLRQYYGPVRLPRVVHHRRPAFGLPDAARGTIRRGQLVDLPVLAQEDFARARGLRPRRAVRRLAVAPPTVLPSASANSVGALDCVISRLNTLPVRTPVNASPSPLRAPTHDSGTPWVATPSM